MESVFRLFLQPSVKIQNNNQSCVNMYTLACFLIAGLGPFPESLEMMIFLLVYPSTWLFIFADTFLPPF